MLIILATGGLTFAFEHSTIAGKIVLSLLAVVSIFSWSIMITKLRVVRFAQKQRARFRAAFRKDRQPLRLFENRANFSGSPIFNVYQAGCQEMTFQLLGSAEVDETFKARLGTADKIAPAQMHAVNAAMEKAVGETALKLESQMILLATAVSGAATARQVSSLSLRPNSRISSASWRTCYFRSSWRPAAFPSRSNTRPSRAKSFSPFSPSFRFSAGRS